MKNFLIIFTFILIPTVMIFTGCNSLTTKFETNVKNEFAAQKPKSIEILSEEHIKSLPEPIKNISDIQGQLENRYRKISGSKWTPICLKKAVKALWFVNALNIV
jgi:hypothetical protein